MAYTNKKELQRRREIIEERKELMKQMKTPIINGDNEDQLV